MCRVSSALSGQLLHSPHNGRLPTMLNGQLLHSLYKKRMTFLRAHAHILEPAQESEEWEETHGVMGILAWQLHAIRHHICNTDCDLNI